MTPIDPLSPARRLADNRARVLAGEDIAPDEYKALLDEMRQIRLAATQSELRRGRTATRSSPVDLDSLIG